MTQETGRRRFAGLTLMLAIAGIFALAASLAVTAGTASAQEPEDDFITYCVDGEPMEVAAADEDTFLDENPDATEGPCEEATEDDTTDDGATDDETDGGLVESAGDESDIVEDGLEEEGDDESIAGDESSEDDASEEASSQTEDVSDPDPSNFPQFNSEPQLPLPSASAPVDDDISPLAESAASEQAGATDETAAASALPSAGSGGLAGGGSAPWAALVGVVLLSLGAAAVYTARANPGS